MDSAANFDSPASWPPLPLDEWQDTYATLHMYMQIVGKVRMELSPPQNHWWHVPLYVTSRGLTTSPIPYRDRTFDVIFDLTDHKLLVLVSDARVAMMPLRPRTVADFYREFMSMLKALEIQVAINTVPQEVREPIPFDHDTRHASYDPEYAHRFWRVLLASNAVFKEFRSRFMGKCSPVHFFWGSFDLAVTRFSGRRAPERPGADGITLEAYSHECSSAGFWPGGDTLAGIRVPGPAFYSYASPEPAGFSAYRPRPDAARYVQGLGEFILMYDDLRREPSPRRALLEFLQSTYEAAADLGHWDRAALEEPPSWPRGEKHAA